MVQVKGKRPFGSQDKKSEVSRKHLVNGTIKAQQLRVITSTGENLGVISRAAA